MTRVLAMFIEAVLVTMVTAWRAGRRTWTQRHQNRAWLATEARCLFRGWTPITKARRGRIVR